MDEKQDVVNAVLKSAKDGQASDGRMKLTCAQAFKLAKEFETENIEIGRICNQHKIKIHKCQLGCFA